LWILIFKVNQTWLHALHEPSYCWFWIKLPYKFVKI